MSERASKFKKGVVNETIYFHTIYIEWVIDWLIDWLSEWMNEWVSKFDCLKILKSEWASKFDWLKTLNRVSERASEQIWLFEKF